MNIPVAIYYYPLIFYKVQITTDYKKIIRKFLVLSVAFAKMGTILTCHTGNNSHKKKVDWFFGV